LVSLNAIFLFLVTLTCALRAQVNITLYNIIFTIFIKNAYKFIFIKQKQKDEHFGIQFMWICRGTWLRWMIMIDPQIVFNIEKLINIICKSIRIIHLSKCTGTYPHNMCTENFTKKKDMSPNLDKNRIVNGRKNF
jgi:hypothetical protein